MEQSGADPSFFGSPRFDQRCPVVLTEQSCFEELMRALSSSAKFGLFFEIKPSPFCLF